ncbi:MAG: (2Fe-2S) ferredoxin domain-containing protein [Planctomycetota bacterium]|nr:MAG: (2Fe-2S) ferredoxin domain-containing protein [Planctomycetota bacterium]
MSSPSHILYPCVSFSLSGDETDPCAQHAAHDLFDYLSQQINERDLDIMICNTGCAQCCESGPVITVQPGDRRYEGLAQTKDIDALLDLLAAEEAAAA